MVEVLDISNNYYTMLLLRQIPSLEDKVASSANQASNDDDRVSTIISFPSTSDVDDERNPLLMPTLDENYGSTGKTPMKKTRRRLFGR